LEAVIHHSILVISKVIQRADIIRAGLELSGYHHSVATVDTAKAALAAVTQHAYKLIIFYQPDAAATAAFDHRVGVAHNLPLVAIGGHSRALDCVAVLPLSYRFLDLLDIVQRFVPLPSIRLAKKLPQFSSREEEARKYRDLFERASDVIMLTDFETHRLWT
jgi:hypothetical protein